MLKIIYLAWAVVVFSIVFWKDGLNPENLTHIGVLAFLAIALVLYRVSKKETGVRNPRLFFITRCALFAAIVEGFYMISNPVFPSLRITAAMPFAQVIRNYSIDLLFTIPAYFLIFYVIWRLINKFHYRIWEYVIIMALGQALGDGIRGFFYQPGLLLLLPYVMVNYHAMNVVPYLKVKNSLVGEGSKSFLRFVVPIILLPAVYLFSGLIIFTIASALKIN